MKEKQLQEKKRKKTQQETFVFDDLSIPKAKRQFISSKKLIIRK